MANPKERSQRRSSNGEVIILINSKLTKKKREKKRFATEVDSDPEDVKVINYNHLYQFKKRRKEISGSKRQELDMLKMISIRKDKSSVTESKDLKSKEASTVTKPNRIVQQIDRQNSIPSRPRCFIDIANFSSTNGLTSKPPSKSQTSTSSLSTSK